MPFRLVSHGCEMGNLTSHQQLTYLSGAAEAARLPGRHPRSHHGTHGQQEQCKGP